MKVNKLVTKIENILPQTQCGLCGHGSCTPYAIAIANKKDTIDKCIPGGLAVLHELSNLTMQDPSVFIEKVQQQYKERKIAKIREDECIGCTKCLDVCPVDAIVGATKKMHTVINSECNGCVF